MVTTIDTGKRIKRTLQVQGIKMIEFAPIAGVTLETLSRYVNGKREIPEPFIVRVAKLLNVTPEYLKCETDDETPPQYTMYNEEMDELQRADARQARRRGAIQNIFEHFGVKIVENLELDTEVYTRQSDLTWRKTKGCNNDYKNRLFDEEIDIVSEQHQVEGKIIFEIEYCGKLVQMGKNEFFDWLDKEADLIESSLHLRLDMPRNA
ncbi:Helix-turn-helix [Butyrivibrio sp. ob235]|uniref:helix-turn-helix domain-containing protein n=1 Tax=Butyrivibrio sp. ob235 TaxID=1761780 RepID=UPI0008C10AE0|nr:helix-turn-helix transcriptional regulator [Butyrivibrio sp. ob235]SEK64942.1 Helix-turn-helix [Butyrivibrio sp. ob235]